MPDYVSPTKYIMEPTKDGKKVAMRPSPVEAPEKEEKPQPKKAARKRKKKTDA